MTPYRALPIRQPWVAAIFHLDKDVENRTWTLIHAAHSFARPRPQKSPGIV